MRARGGREGESERWVGGRSDNRERDGGGEGSSSNIASLQMTQLSHNEQRIVLSRFKE